MTSPPDQSFANLTPMLRQYTQAKAAHPDAIVLFRLGDFTRCLTRMPSRDRVCWNWC